jgi:hypothetical protein
MLYTVKLTIRNMKKLLPFTLMMILLPVIFSGCKKDKGEPPSLPPVESMKIDFSNFSALNKGTGAADQKGVNTTSWEFAATAAGVWSLLINSTLAVPVAAFKAAIEQKASNIDSKTWQWSYNISVSGSTYKARLTGQTRTSDILWKMYVTKEGAGGFSEFVWFDGTSKIDGTGGQWIIYYSSQNPDATLQIDWTKADNSIKTVKYTYLRNDTFRSSYIEFGTTSGTFNAYFNVHYYNGIKFSDVNIEWNTSSHNGRIKSFDYLGDTNWYCWNSNKVDVTC